FDHRYYYHIRNVKKKAPPRPEMRCFLEIQPTVIKLRWRSLTCAHSDQSPLAAIFAQFLISQTHFHLIPPPRLESKCGVTSCRGGGLCSSKQSESILQKRPSKSVR